MVLDARRRVWSVEQACRRRCRLRIEFRSLGRIRVLRCGRAVKATAASMVPGHRGAILSLLAAFALARVPQSQELPRPDRADSARVFRGQCLHGRQPSGGGILFAAVPLLGIDDRRHLGLPRAPQAGARPQASGCTGGHRTFVDRRSLADPQRRQPLSRMVGLAADAWDLSDRIRRPPCMAQPPLAGQSSIGMDWTHQLSTLFVALAGLVLCFAAQRAFADLPGDRGGDQRFAGGGDTC